MVKRKKKAAHDAAPKRRRPPAAPKRKRQSAKTPKAKKSRRSGGRKLTVSVVVPHVLRIDSPELAGLCAEKRLELAMLGTAKKHASRPSWAVDEAVWRKAMRAVSPHWRRYEHPYAAVAFVYQRMGGNVRSAAVHRPEAVHTHRIHSARVSARAPHPTRRAHSEHIEVERVQLDELGYDPDGRYHGFQHGPLWRVSAADFEAIIPARNQAEARTIALQQYRH